MTLNLQYLASFPKDPAVARRRLLEITSSPPDVICVQEGLEGIDLFGQVGYTKLISSAVKAQPLCEALYQDEALLAAVPEVAHNSLLVNEMYIKNDCLWHVVETGVEQISSPVSVPEGELVTRSAVWAKLTLSSEAEGPFVWVMNTQLSGSRSEERFLAQLADERRCQILRALDLFALGGEDLGVLVGDFGPVSGPGDAEAPLRGLRDRGWCLAYDQSTIPASCFFGFLADYMATSRQVHAHSIEALATANIIGEAQLDVPLSDHSAVKAAFPMAPSGSAEAEEMPLLGFGSHFMPEDLTERVSDEDFLKHVDEITQAAIQEALSAGVRLIDSGNRQMNQQSVGRALERAMSDGVVSRGELFISGRISKCKDREQIRGELEMLLSELKLDYVDLLIADCPPEQVPSAWPFLEEALRENRCRFLGVSNFDLLGPKVSVEVFRQFLAATKTPPAVMAMEVHPLNTNEEMCECCRSMGIQVLAYSPLGAPHKVESFMKVLAKSDARDMRPLVKVAELPLLQTLARRHEVSPAQVALRWNLQRGHSVVPKSWNPSHICENVQLFNFNLTTEEMAGITKLHKGVRAERFFQASFSTASKALPRMTRDGFDECQKILNKIRGPNGAVAPGHVPHLDGPVPLPADVAQRGGHDSGEKVDWEKLGFHRPVEEEPGFWRRMGLATGKGMDGKGKGKGRFPELKEGLPVGGKGVPRPAMVGYR